MKWLSSLIMTVVAPMALSAVEKQPNILYIMADDHAAHAISAYGSKINKTPNIDRIAKDGMRFNNCFVTNSICTPSRAAILTGKYSHINGVPVFNHFDGSQPTLAKVSAEGRLSHRHDRQMAPRQRSHRLRLLEHPARPGRLSRSRLHHAGRPQEAHKGYCTDVITDLSLDFLEEPAQGQTVLPDVPPQGPASALGAG